MTAPDGPADTRIMGIVHEALKRDLRRVRAVVAASPEPGAAQREALGEHVVWMMRFLHAHHTSEDEGLWPLVRTRNPASAELLDGLEADHAVIAPAAGAVEACGAAYAGSDDETMRSDLVAALDRLVEVLVPHLDREVSDAMPVVSASITSREWDEVERRHTLRPKSVRVLAMQGHWLIEGIDQEGYEVVVQKVPRVVRWVIVHGFARAYRRQAAARWGVAA
jgi:hemerythrin-like domain-containing protein